MDKAKKEQVTKWAQTAIAACGPMSIQDSSDGYSLSFTGEPTSVVLEEGGLAKVSVETEGHFQMILAALMYERGRAMMAAADALMLKSKTAKE